MAIEAPTHVQKENLADLLTRRRRELKISQMVAAKMIGVSKGAYQSWEQHRAMPDSARYQEIARFLGMNSTADLWAVLTGIVAFDESSDRSYEAIKTALETTVDLCKLPELINICSLRLMNCSHEN
jgi:transcriptional regulator with XRE-family HTH domain